MQTKFSGVCPNVPFLCVKGLHLNGFQDNPHSKIKSDSFDGEKVEISIRILSIMYNFKKEFTKAKRTFGHCAGVILCPHSHRP